MTNIFQKIKDTKGSKAKLELAKKEFTIRHHNFMEVCFNDVSYGISNSGIKKAIGWTNEFGKGEDIADFVKQKIDKFDEEYLDEYFPISSNNIDIQQFSELIEPLSGNKQIEKFRELLSMTPIKDDIIWYIRAIQKDLRIGLSLSSYNKVREANGMKAIVKRGVQLCGKREVTPEMENFADLSYPRIAEYKYDGERCEIMLENEKVDEFVTITKCKLTSRQGKDITDRYPEVVKFLIDNFAKEFNPGAGIVKKVVYDSEIISKDFITLSKRMQRKAENIEEDDTDLKAIIFDILEVEYYDDIFFIFSQYSQDRRRGILEDHAEFYGWDLSYIKTVENKEELYQFYLDARAINQEGLVTKDLEMKWTPHSRDGWYKLVPRETLDLKVIEGSYGNGIFSKYINCLTVTNNDETIKTNVASGIKNHEREELTKLHDAGNLKDLVVEIAYRELCPSKDGVCALRFPVFVRIRDDKSLKEID